jgi:hypothetical protein
VAASVIEFEVIRACTLDRGDDRISLRPGARLRIAPHDDDFCPTQIQRAIAQGKLRRIGAGNASLIAAIFR